MLAPQLTQLLQGKCVRSNSLKIKTRLAVSGEVVTVFLAFEGMVCPPTEAVNKGRDMKRPFYRYGDHIELFRFKEYYRMLRGHEHISFVFSSAFRTFFLKVFLE